jgi:hypothetical protein
LTELSAPDKADEEIYVCQCLLKLNKLFLINGQNFLMHAHFQQNSYFILDISQNEKKWILWLLHLNSSIFTFHSSIFNPQFSILEVKFQMH